MTKLKFKNFLKHFVLFSLSIGCLYSTYIFISTLNIIITNDWFMSAIFTLSDFLYLIFSLIGQYFLLVLYILHYYFKGKIKKNNDLLQGFWFLCVLFIILAFTYTMYLLGYDILSLVNKSKEHILYGDFIYHTGFLILFTYLTKTLKPCLLEGKKHNYKIIILGVSLFLIGLLLNDYLIQIY